VVSLLHVAPSLFAEVYNSARTGDRVRARQILRGAPEIIELALRCLERRPETSTMFHFLNYALRRRWVCENILLDHEGICPDWLTAEVEKAVELGTRLIGAEMTKEAF
jgi:hypothetical protein